jgi:ribonuclease HI
MPKLFVDANPRCVAYVLENGGSGYQMLPAGYTSMEAEYLAISYGLNEYFLKWNKELDARHGDLDVEKSRATGETEFADVASPADKTQRPLPPPVLVCSDNEVVVKQLSREYHIANDRLRKLAQQIWQQIQNVDVKFQWIPRAENTAGMMLK